jgi:hypothetical protein
VVETNVIYPVLVVNSSGPNVGVWVVSRRTLREAGSKVQPAGLKARSIQT